MGSKKDNARNETKGEKGFEAFYAAAYGDRWATLKAALLAPVRQIARLNKFHAHEPTLSQTYAMDFASVAPARALDVQPGDRVLDLCAAPGGKSLILAEGLGDDGELIANELSDNRRFRLLRVIRDYLPASLRERVKVTGHDGTRWGLHEQDAFDRILLDAPCSGERHLLETTEEMARWSAARSKNLAVRQYALLTSAWLALKPGGRLVYATCSLSPRENDDVVARLVKKKEGVLVRSATFEVGEATELGWRILPDQTGYGPIYFAVLEKEKALE